MNQHSRFKEEISVYFDINPHDGLLETHDVDESLKEKLKCLVFIPIISRTFCDPKAFAWEHEFKAFVEKASKDQFGLKVKLPNGNVASRVLLVQIHDLKADDKTLVENVLGGFLRPVEFIYSEPGVNRPLTAKDPEDKNINKTNYRNQINKVANAIDELITALKTEPISAAKEKSTITKSVKENLAEDTREHGDSLTKKGKSGFLVPVVIVSLLLIAVVGFVIIKKSGSRKSLNSMTMPVTVINENREKEVRRIFKDRYITRLAIFPFSNETSDSSGNWLRYGFMDAIWEDLYQFSYILSREDKAAHLQEQITYAENNNYPHFLTGTFRISDGKYQVTSKLYQTVNGSVISERTFRGNEFFSIIDSISLHARIDLGVSNNIIRSSPDLPFKEHSTNNMDAFRYYISGLYLDSLPTNLHRAIEIDSTFAMALYNRALNNYTYQRCYESALTDINQAMRHRQRLPEYNNISIRILYYLIHGDNNKAIALAEMQHELKPKDASILEGLLDLYERELLFNKKYIRAQEQLAELVPDDPYYFYAIAYGYLRAGELDKGLEVSKRLLKANSENVDALLLMGEIYLHKNDPETAKKMYQKAILIQPENEKDWLNMFNYISFSQNKPVNNEFLRPFNGYYRFEDGEMTIAFYEHNNHPVVQATNQNPLFNYPVSEMKFISINGTASFTFVKNNQGEVIKTILDQFDSSVAWKEDSLIIEARSLLNEGDNTGALYAFRNAFASNPDHYYLDNFIRHLEFIQSEDYERTMPFMDKYIGKYGDRAIFRKNNNFYYKDYNGYIYKLLPVSQDKFMMPSFYNREVRIIRKNNSIEGLKIMYRDGKEEFFPGNN